MIPQIFSSLLPTACYCDAQDLVAGGAACSTSILNWPSCVALVGSVSDPATTDCPWRAHVLKTTGEIEAAVCSAIARFEQEYMGRGPKDIRTHLIGDMLLVRLQGVLTAAEQQLVRTLKPEKGRDLLKEVRTQLIETARPGMEAMIKEITGLEPISLHHDISTITGEEILLFVFSESPGVRETKRK